MSPMPGHDLRNKLERQLGLLRDGLSKIPPASREPHDRWVIPIYERNIEWRERLLRILPA